MDRGPSFQSTPPGSSYCRPPWPRRQSDRTVMRNSSQLIVVRASEEASQDEIPGPAYLSGSIEVDPKAAALYLRHSQRVWPCPSFSWANIDLSISLLTSSVARSTPSSTSSAILITAYGTHSRPGYFTRLAMADGTQHATRMNNHQAARNHPFAGGLASRGRRQTRRVLNPIGTTRRSNPIPPPPARRLDHLALEFRPGANRHVTRAAVLEQSFIIQAWYSISVDAAYYLGTFFQESSFHPDSGLLVQEEMARFLPLLVCPLPETGRATADSDLPRKPPLLTTLELTRRCWHSTYASGWTLIGPLMGLSVFLFGLEARRVLKHEGEASEW